MSSAPETTHHGPSPAATRRRGVDGWSGYRLLGLLAVLLLVDALVLAGDVGFHLGDDDERFAAFASARWNSQADRSYAEVLGYAQLGAAALVLLVGALRHRAALLAGWAALLAVVVVDDAAGLHERGGLALVDALDLPALLGLRPDDLGEMAVWAAYGLPLGLVVLVLHLRSPSRVRRASWWLAAGFVPLGAAGAGLDMLHSALAPPGSVVGLLLGSLESVGELASMSLLLVLALVAVGVVRRTGEGQRLS
ncbi:hypothetical protein [uncultured Pseudokineococcus sp.]|uniref:hypothetical protein n=1 Tax=uncultured Pseudokineococcus sp. TaxID=1642928 RepID=UPI00262153D9|nr:hypothetical protein [uncultured Pseudokineococcus sp.]